MKDAVILSLLTRFMVFISSPLYKITIDKKKKSFVCPDYSAILLQKTTLYIIIDKYILIKIK